MGDTCALKCMDNRVVADDSRLLPEDISVDGLDRGPLTFQAASGSLRRTTCPCHRDHERVQVHVRGRVADGRLVQSRTSCSVLRRAQRFRRDMYKSKWEVEGAKRAYVALSCSPGSSIPPPPPLYIGRRITPGPSGGRAGQVIRESRDGRRDPRRVAAIRRLSQRSHPGLTDRLIRAPLTRTKMHKYYVGSYPYYQPILSISVPL